MTYVKLDHIHEETGKQCFVVTGGLKDVYRLRVGGRECSVAYRPYTGHWYAYDDNGRDLATFTRKFFEQFIRSQCVGSMEPDPDCKTKSIA